MRLLRNHITCAISFLVCSSLFSTDLIYKNTGITGLSHVKLEVYPESYYSEIKTAVSKYVTVKDSSPNVLWFGINVNKLRKGSKGYFGTVEINLMRRAVFLTNDDVNWEQAGSKDKLYTLLKAYTSSQSIYNDTTSNSIRNHVNSSVVALLKEMFAKRKEPTKPMIR